MTTKFLVGFDYGSGGLWRVVSAVNKSQIVERYPELVIVDDKPDWMSDERLADLNASSINIDDNDNDFFQAVVSGRKIINRGGK